MNFIKVYKGLNESTDATRISEGTNPRWVLRAAIVMLRKSAYPGWWVASAMVALDEAREFYILGSEVRDMLPTDAD